MKLTEARRRPGTPSPFKPRVYAAGACSRNGRLLSLKRMRVYVQRPRRCGTHGDGVIALLERIRSAISAFRALLNYAEGRAVL